MGEQPFEIPYEGDELTRATRRKIDEALISLKTERNELSPISVLPPEVLSNIFILVRDRSTEIQPRNGEAPWIYVGQVCHHWREVALSCPTLWSIPVFTIPNLAHEMMQRSKEAALTIKADTNTRSPRILEELENAMTQIHRIQSIDLLLMCHLEKLSPVLSPLSQPAPLLEEVVLHLTIGSASSEYSFPINALSDVPRLRSIDFGHFKCSWESAVFRQRNLTSLRLNNNFSGNATVGEMMDALRHLPNLRTLALTRSIPLHTTSTGNEKPLEFKFLEQLELLAEAADCISFLHHIQYPPCTAVKLYSLATEPEDCRTIFSLVAQNLRCAQSNKSGTPRSPIVIRSVQLTSFEGGGPEVNFFQSTKHLLPCITIRLSGHYYNHSARWASILPTISGSFDISSAQVLLLDWVLEYIDTDEIFAYFKKLPKLNTFKVYRSDLQTVCALIAGDLDFSGTKSQHSSPTPLLPALRNLAFERMDINHHLPEDYYALVNMLTKRSNMGVPLDKLSFEKYYSGRNWIKKHLGGFVVDLEIEGKVIDLDKLEPADEQDTDTDDGDEDEDEYLMMMNMF